MKNFLMTILLVMALGTSLPGTAKPLLISAGGYGSCPLVGSPSEMRASKQIAALAKKLGADLMKTCFALSPFTVIYKDPKDGWTRRRSIKKYLQMIAQLDLKDGVYLVGQSYGGWLAMKTALALPASVKARGLATVDAISPVHCPPHLMAASFVGGPIAGCTQAPMDLVTRFNEVRSRVGSWTHFYQTNFRHLHSSEIREADKTTEMEYPPTMLPFGAHLMTETDQRIWDEIGATFTN